MPTPPDAEAVKVYLSSIDMDRWDDDAVEEALDAEIENQRNRIRFPADPPSPADPLPYTGARLDALFRRVARNLALRPLPLGVQATSSENAVSQVRIGGLDADVRRLEAPYLKVNFG